jgi:transposase
MRTGTARGQESFLPRTLDEVIPAGHPVRFVAAWIELLKEKGVHLRGTVRREGRARFDPYVLLGIWVYGFMTRVRSSRKLERACCEVLPFIWLAREERPDHTTLARFYQANLDLMRELFKRTVEVAAESNLVGFAVHAIDGTRIPSVSVKRSLTAGAMEKLLERTDAVIAEMEKTLAVEMGEGATEDWMPEELQDAVQLRERLLHGLEVIRARELARRGNSKGTKGSKIGKAEGPRVNLADPEAVVMKGAHGFVAGYNAQAAVDGKAQIIVGAELVADGTDTAQLPSMLEEVKETAGGLAMVTACDAGYHSAGNLEAMQGEATNWYAPDPKSKRRNQPEKAPFHKDRFQHNVETDTYTCPEGKLLTLAWQQKPQQGGQRVYRCTECLACPHFGTCTKDREGRRLKISARDQLLRQHREKMRGEAGKFWVKMRATLVEPAFGIIKEHLGMTRFLRRGKENAQAEWFLVCAAYNLNKIIRRAGLEGSTVALVPI